MRFMYVILSWMGWITLAAALGFVVGYVRAERDARRAGRRSDEGEVHASDEKQS